MSKWIITIGCIVAWWPASTVVCSQDQSAEIDKELQQAGQLLDLLKRRPSFGTVLNRVSSFYTERGRLDELITRLRSVPPSQADAVVQHQIAGMLQIQRGHGAEAVALLEEVVRIRDADPVAAQALGLALQDAGEVSAAIKAFESALEKQPTKPDLRTIYSDLARLQHRAGHPERSLEVWKKLEAEFPADRAIQEDVAARLQEDGQLQPALERWENLAANETNPERRSQYLVSVAEIQLRQGDNTKARETLEVELEQIRPGSWLDDVIRGKVEAIVLRSDGQQGIIKYYRHRLAQHPQDDAAVSRLAALLANQGQFDEAASMYTRAIERRPSSVKLRMALIDLLATQGKLSAAVKAGREMLKLRDAGTAEFELVGRLLLRDPTREQSRREQEASRVWMQICRDPLDAAMLGYTARLHRRSGLSDRAVALFRQVSQLEPDNPDWREELGQTLFESGRRDEALREWNAIAEGSRRNTGNLTKLSELLENAGEFAGALTTMQQACELQPGISDRIRLARLLRRSGHRDAGYTQLDLAADSATSTADQRIVNEARIEAWKQDPALFVRMARLQKRLEQDSDNAEGWLRLALLCQTDQRPVDAVRSVERATTVDPQSVLAWQAASKIYVAAGLLDRAASANRQLADVSPPTRMTALQQVVRLEQQLGRPEKALDAAEQLVRESPGHTDGCRQFAELCFESGRDMDGLNCLKKCLTLNPHDYQLSIELAEMMAQRFQTDEASSMLWRTFGRVDDLSHRLSLIEALIQLAKQTNSVDRTIERLTVATNLDPVDRVLCVATAQNLAGEPASAGNTLEQGAQRYGRDLQILRMQVELAEQQNELEFAAEIQRQVAAISATSDEQIRLATLCFKTGTLSESELSWIRDARSGNDTPAAFRSIDRFLDGGRVEAAELMCQRLANDRPGDWRALYRLAMIQWRLDRREQAAATLQKIVDLDLATNHVFAEPGSGPEASGPTEPRGPLSRQEYKEVVPAGLSPMARRVNQVVNALTWLQLYTGNELHSQRLTAPADYGGARCAAAGLLWLNEDSDGRNGIVAELVETIDATDGQIAEWCAIAVTTRWVSRPARPARLARVSKNVRFSDLLEVLAASDDIEHQLLLAGLLCRGGVFRTPAIPAATESSPRTSRMLLTAAENVAASKPEWLADIGGWAAVYRELKRSNQAIACGSVIARLSESSDPSTVISATDLAIAHRDVNAVSQCIHRMMALRSKATSIRDDLDARRVQLASIAAQMAQDDHWDPVRQLVDLLLEIRMTHYEANIEKSAADGTRFRLEHRRAAATDGPAYLNLPTVGPACVVIRYQDENPVRLLRPRTSGVSRRNLQLTFNKDGDAADHLDQPLAALLQYLCLPNAVQRQKLRLLEHLKTTAQDQSKPVWIPASITLAHFHIIERRADDAMSLLIPVVEHLPEDVSLRLLMARYLLDVGDHRDALTLLDQPAVQHDRHVILSREKTALRLCVALNDQDRAQLAASRLFELELDPEDVQFIAEQFDALHMPEISKRFQARISSRPLAERAEQLRQLMQSYLSGGNKSAAARIARQLILQPSITLEGTSLITAVQVRTEALQILAGSDAVKPMIRQLQSQTDNAPASFHQRHLLIELLRADGRESEAEAAAGPLRQSLVQDPEKGIQLARQLERQGRLESACDVCRYLLEADTKLFHRDYYRFIRLFEKNGRLGELADLILSSDLREESNSHWGVQQLTERLLPLDETQGLKLFAAAWHAWPASRQAVLANVSDEAIWNLPEVFEHSKVRLLPTQNGSVGPWFGVAEQLQVRGRGVVTGTLSRMLQVPVVKGHADEFLNEIQKALAIQPDWHAGWIYAALVKAHLGRTDAALTHLLDLLDRQLVEMPPMVAWITACELHKLNAPPLSVVVTRLLEHLNEVEESGTVLLKSGTAWHAAPDYLLIQYYAANADTDLMGTVLDRLLTRFTGSANDSVHELTRENQAARNELARDLQPSHPIAAKRLRDLSRPESRRPSVPHPTESAHHTAKTGEVIQAIRERLLQQRP